MKKYEKLKKIKVMNVSLLFCHGQMWYILYQVFGIATHLFDSLLLVKKTVAIILCGIGRFIIIVNQITIKLSKHLDRATSSLNMNCIESEISLFTIFTAIYILDIVSIGVYVNDKLYFNIQCVAVVMQHFF